MAEVMIPLFPLDHVLMPGCGLPLRIFESRYRQLLADVTGLDGDRRFGVVSLLEGREVLEPGTEDTPFDGAVPRTAHIGTMAEILEVEPFSDGTSSVLTVGSSRFEIVRLTETPAPYLVAEVRMLNEPVGDVPDGLAESARSNALAYTDLLARLTRIDADLEPYPRDPIALSYRLASDTPLPRAERQALLELDSAADRLRAVARILRRELMLLRETRTIAVSSAVLNEVLGRN